MRLRWWRRNHGRAEPQPDSLADDLRKHLYWAMVNPPPGSRYRWVMTMDWWNECRKIDTYSTLWHPGGRIPMVEPDLLMGIPVDIRDDGGVPHLEAAHGGA